MTTPAQLPASTPTPHRSSVAWPFAAVLITLTLVVGLPIAYLTLAWTKAPARIINSLSMAAAEAVRPKVTVNEIVLSSIDDLHKSSKLVVFETVLNADVTREEGESSWGMYWGSNVARVAVTGARVPYVIDLSQLGTGDFEYNDAAKTLTVTLPKPKIDTGMVSIDPAKIQTLDLRGGWARFNKYETRDRAIAELRPKIIIQAHAPYIQKLAQTAGIESSTALLQPLADTLAKDGITIKIAYAGS